MKVKKSFWVLLSIAVLLSLTVSLSMAQGQLPGSGWYTGHTIANVGTGPATINVVAYDSKSNNTYTYTPPAVAAGDSVTWLPDDFSPALPENFAGSAVASSDQDMRAIINVTNRQLGSLGTAGGEGTAQYRGVTSADVSVAFPLVKYKFPAGHPAQKSTTLFLQNAGAEATTITVNFVGTGCSPCSYTTPSIGVGQMVAVSANDANGVGEGFAGPATATSDKSNVPIAGVYMETPALENPATQAQAGNGFTPADYDSTILVPVYKKTFGGRNTGLEVQNVGTGNVDLVVTYKGDAVLGHACAGQTHTNNSATNVAPGTSARFLMDSVLPDDCLASATIEATLSAGSSGTTLIAGTINESFGSIPAGSNQQSTIYAAFPASAATTKVSLPVVKDQFGPKTTGITCQNVGTADATNVVYKYVISLKQAAGNTGDIHTTASQSIKIGASQTLLNPSGNASLWSGPALPAKTLNAVTVTADQPIVCIANEAVFNTPGNNQDKNNYEGFNLTP